MGDRVIRLSLREEADLVATVASLIQGGIDLVGAYRSAEGMLKGRSASAAGAIVTRLERGASVSAAARTVLERIEPMHLAMLGVMDRTGDVTRPMIRADRYLQTRLRLRAKTSAAALYPACVIGATVAGCLLLILVVIPAAESILASGGAIAADATRSLSGRGMSVVVFGMVAVAGTGTIVLVSPRSGSHAPVCIDRARLAVPVTGKMEGLVDLLAFSHAIAAMVDAGIALGEALRGAVPGMRNAAMRHDIATAARLVENGIPVSRAMAHALPGFEYIARWFALCESGADLSEALTSLSRFVEIRLDRLVGRVSTLIEPILIAVAGLVVLVVVVGFVKPLFELYGSLIP